MIEFDIEHTQGDFRLAVRLASEAPVIGLFGPSGAGKSTLLNILSGGITPHRGRIVINGHCMLDTQKGLNVPMHQRRIGIVYQEGRLFPHLSVKGNLDYGLHLTKRAERRHGFDEIVAMLEIGHLLKSKPNRLSGGERQRVALGRALLTSPRLLLLDEPLASLDERLKAQILPFLRRVKEETSTPMVYVSHAIREILELTRQLAVIQDGAILASGEYHDVLTSETVVPLAQSLGIENMLSVSIIEHHPELGYSIGETEGRRWVLPLSQAPMGSETTVIVPASNISLARTSITGTTIQNQVEGRVMQIRVLDHRALVTLDISALDSSTFDFDSRLLVEVSAKSIQDLAIEAGQLVYALIKTQSIRYLGS